MPLNDARSFKADLQNFADKIDLDLAKFRMTLTLKLKAKVEQRTPVLSGRLRASWAASDGVPSTWVPPEGQSNALGPIEADFSHPFESSFITSNLPYVMAIEFGHSKQAPQGMVRIALAEMQTELEGSFGEL